jgi:hypothetical protein
LRLQGGDDLDLDNVCTSIESAQNISSRCFTAVLPLLRLRDFWGAGWHPRNRGELEMGVLEAVRRLPTLVSCGGFHVFGVVLLFNHMASSGGDWPRTAARDSPSDKTHHFLSPSALEARNRSHVSV